jgi:hypothetical protein
MSDFRFQIWPQYAVSFHENDERALSQDTNLTDEIQHLKSKNSS